MLFNKIILYYQYENLTFENNQKESEEKNVQTITAMRIWGGEICLIVLNIMQKIN